MNIYNVIYIYIYAYIYNIICQIEHSLDREGSPQVCFMILTALVSV